MATSAMNTTVCYHDMSSNKPPMSTSGTLFSTSLSQSPEPPLLQAFLSPLMALPSRIHPPRSKAVSKLINWWKGGYSRKLRAAHIGMLEDSFPNILREKTGLSRPRKSIKLCKIDMLAAGGLIFLTHLCRMLFLNGCSNFRRSFCLMLKVSTIQVRVAKTSLVLKPDANLISSSNGKAMYPERHTTGKTFKSLASTRRQTAKTSNLYCSNLAGTYVMCSLPSRPAASFTDFSFMGLP